MKKIILALFLMTSFYPNLALGETTREEATRVCKIYVSNPKKFIKPKAEDCQCAGNACQCVSLKNGSNPTKFAYIQTGGSCGSSGVGKFTGEDDNVDQLNFLNGDDGFGMGSYVGLLDYNGKIYAEINGNHKSLARVDKDGLTILCGISHVFKYPKNPAKESSKLCEKFSKGAFAEFKIEKSSASTLEGVDMPRWTEVKKHITQDLDSDGKIDSIYLLQMASGAGCGCDKSYLGTEEQLKASLTMDGASPSSTVFSETRCGSVSDVSVVTINDKLYLMEAISSEHFDNANDNRRRLIEFSNGNLKTICEQKADITNVIDVSGENSFFKAAE